MGSWVGRLSFLRILTQDQNFDLPKSHTTYLMKSLPSQWVALQRQIFAKALSGKNCPMSIKVLQTQGTETCSTLQSQQLAQFLAHDRCSKCLLNEHIRHGLLRNGHPIRSYLKDTLILEKGWDSWGEALACASPWAGVWFLEFSTHQSYAISNQVFHHVWNLNKLCQWLLQYSNQ